MAVTVMHGNGMTNHLGENGARAAPGANHLLLAFSIHFLDAFQKFWVYIRPFFQ
jgi:hypothetical protein